MARQKFRGPKNEQLVKTVARAKLFFFLLFFSFSLILKRKEEYNGRAVEKMVVVKEAKTVAFHSKTVATGCNEIKGSQEIATEPPVFSRCPLPSGLRGRHCLCAYVDRERGTRG